MTSPSPSPLPEPTPHRWHLMIVSAFLWESGGEQFVASPQSDLTSYLLRTLHRLNTQARCIYTEEQIEEIKKNIKAMLLRFRHYEDVNIGQWIEPEDRANIKTNETGYRVLEKVKYAIFILEDDSDESLVGHILVSSIGEDYWSCWSMERDGDLDRSWIEKINRFLLTPVEIYLPFSNGTESKLLLIDSYLSYGVFEQDITIIPKGRTANKGDPAIIVRGKIRSDYDRDYYIAITGDLYTYKGERLEGKEYLFDPPIGEFTLTHVPAHDFGAFEMHFKYEGQDIESYDLFLAIDPHEAPPP